MASNKARWGGDIRSLITSRHGNLERVVEQKIITTAKVAELYADREGLARKAVLNVASSGKFSGDRTIAEYAAEIWHA